MKHFCPLFLASILGFLSACTIPAELNENNNNEDGLFSPNNFVDLSEIEAFAQRAFLSTKTGEKINYTIEAMRCSTGDTVAYLVNTQNHGWRILSADSRTPAILAEDYRGSFSIEDGSPALEAWIDCMKADMAAVRRASDDQLKFSAEEIAINKSFWRGDPPGDPLPIDIPEPGDGHWYVQTTSEIMDGDSVLHMTPHWDQGHPYNVYCPFKISAPSERAYAGCVAVAGAEVLYYLNKKLGTPSQMFSYCECPGNINNPQIVFDSFSPSVWAQMDTLYNPLFADKEAIMIAYMGYLVDMDYGDGNNGSGADDADLKNSAFPANGISCARGNYKQDTVKFSLEQRLPVIVSAYSQLLFGSGHCFVIDGYKKQYTKFTHYHYWVPDEPLSWYDHNLYAPYYTYSSTTPVITSIKINWGWWSQWPPYNRNDGWYTLTGDWYTENASGQGTSYNYYRKMIYGFAASH